MSGKEDRINTTHFDSKIMNRISDAFVALDADWHYTFVNKKAGEILGRTPESLIGKHIWTEFPEVIGQPFHQIYYKAMETQEVHHLREYYPPFDKWFENRIYPSQDGLSIFFTDITKQVQAEKFTEEELERFQLYKKFLDNTSDSFQVAREDGYLVFANEEAIRRLGLDAENIGNTHVMDFEDGFRTIDDWKNHVSKMKKLKKQVFESSNTNIKTGKQIHIEVTVSFETIDNTNYIIAVSRDISDRKIAEQLLFDSQKLNSNVLESITDGVSMLDTKGTHLMVNRAFCEMLGCCEDEIIGTGVPHFYWPEEHVTEINEAFEKTELGIKKDFQLIFKRRNGERFPVIVSPSHILDENGTITHLIATVKDVSELNKAQDIIQKNEERLRAVLESSNLGIWDYDVATNKTIRTLQHDLTFGLSDYHPNWEFNTFYTYIHEEDREDVKKAYDRLLTEGGNCTVDYRLPLDDGSIRWLNSTGKAILNENNEVVRVIGIVQDITNRKESELEIIDSNREKETLLAEIHHRVKNNLAVVAGLMYLQTKDTDNQELIERLNININRIKSIAGIHEELYKSHNYSQISFAANIRKVLENITSVSFNHNDVNIELDLEDVSLNIRDALPAALIINELVTNAFKHAFTGISDPTIRIGLKKVNNYTYLIIRDNGVGLPKDFKPNASLSIGINLITSLAEQLEADIKFENNGGLTCTLIFESIL